MPRLRDLSMFAVSGLLSAALSGMLVVMISLCAVAGPFGLLIGVVAGFEGVRPAILVVGLPAILIGGILWSAGAEQPRLRRKSIWAAIGALTGALGYACAYGFDTAELRTLTEVARLDVAGLLIVFALAGAGAALAFRAFMKLFALFLPDGPA
jgi:hypothetical protein